MLDRAVDDRVGADLDALALGRGAGVAHGAHAEGQDDRVGSGGQHYV
jgi:hypothetical protein